MLRSLSVAVALVAIVTAAPVFPVSPNSAEAASPRGEFRVPATTGRGALLRPQQPRFPRFDASQAAAATQRVPLNRMPPSLRGYAFGRSPSYPGYVPRATGNTSRRTGHQAQHVNPGPNGWNSLPTGRQVGGIRPAGRGVDPQWRPRQEAIARSRLAWAQACVKSRRANATRDCNPPMQFETPRSSAYEDAVIASDGTVFMPGLPARKSLGDGNGIEG